MNLHVRTLARRILRAFAVRPVEPRSILTSAAVVIAVMSLTVVVCFASLTIGYVAESASGRVIMNLFAMNGLSEDWEFRMVHEVEALDVIRLDLLRAHRIRDLPILVYGPWQTSGTNMITLEDQCATGYGEATGTPKIIGTCLMIEVATPYSFDDLLAMTVALSEVSAGGRTIGVKDRAAFRTTRASETQPYRNLTLHFDPIWSPDGTRLLYTVWELGKDGLELVEMPSSAVTRLEPLEGDMCTRPVWSADSRLVAYATLGMVKVYDTQTRTTKTFRPKQHLDSSYGTTIGSDGTRLYFQFDLNRGGGYETYALETPNQELQPLVSWPIRPNIDLGTLAPENPLEQHSSLKPVRSPTGRYVAIFTFVSGQRRIKVRSLQ